MVGWTSQTVDIAYCAGSGDDLVSVATGNGVCGTVATKAWNYGSANYWLELWGQSGRDKLQGGTGHDRLCGGSGHDGGPTTNPAQYYLHGLSSADDIDGWTGNDYCDGYTGSGDQAWGYDGSDYVIDLVHGPGDTVFGEDDADRCVYIDETIGSPPDLEINGGRATCDPPSCTCGTTDDDSCSDRSPNAASLTIGVEIQSGAYCPTD